MTIQLRNRDTGEILYTEDVPEDRLPNAIQRYRAEARRLGEGYEEHVVPVPDETQKLVDGELVAKSLDELVADGVITQEQADERAAEQVRAERDRLLTQTDYMVLPDCPEDSEAVRKYRQSLRDITKQKGFPHKVTWPEL
jgi:hypothetical protein